VSEGEDGLVFAADDVEAGVHQALDHAAFDDCPSVHLWNNFKTFIKIHYIWYAAIALKMPCLRFINITSLKQVSAFRML